MILPNSPHTLPVPCHTKGQPVKPRTRKSIEEIEQFVSRGYSQSAANCRVLLDEIYRLRALIANKDQPHD